MRYGQKIFYVDKDNNEFLEYEHPKYNFFKMHNDVGHKEKIYKFINEFVHDIKLDSNYEFDFIDYKTTHGGFIPIHCENSFENVYMMDVTDTQQSLIKKNIANLISKNKHNKFHFNLDNYLKNNFIIIHSIDDYNYIDEFTNIDNNKIIAITKSNINKFNYSYPIDDYYVCINSEEINNIFKEKFLKFYTKNNKFEFDNLINLVVMVRNGGELFKKMLEENKRFIDRWTVLDTGSTDGSQDVVRNILSDIKGDLYEEPFIDFRESRNRSIELAGNFCKFNIILDDTYILKGDIRSFLKSIRDDVKGDSLSILITSDDVEYGSNRIIKTHHNLKYECKIHEIIQEYKNINIMIPKEEAFILDESNPYMKQRTMDRKLLDITLLNEMIEEEPDNPRHLYYLGHTYNLLQKYEIAADYFLKRVEHFKEGFIQEKIDACFELARIYNFKLNKPWEECEKYYIKAYEMDKTRPESLYFIGIHYYLNGDRSRAFENFRKAFKIGYPIHTQYSLKPTISYHFLPNFLTQLCYEFRDFKLGEECAKLYLDKTEYNDPKSMEYRIIKDWHQMFTLLNKMDFTLPPSVSILNNNNNKQIVCFIADGGFSHWTGRDILKNGVGGSETHVIEMATYISKHTNFDVYVFCNTQYDDVFNGVNYHPLSKVFNFLVQNHISYCIISRFSEYLPLAIEGNVENIYLFLHDLTPTGLIIPDHHKLKKIFRLSEWHTSYFTNIFKTLEYKTTHHYYGVDTVKFECDIETEKLLTNKNKIKFIYSSFPNRGLSELLDVYKELCKQFPDILELHLYCDVDGKWVNQNFPDLMRSIREKMSSFDSKHIVYHGWVDKQTLANGWKECDIWLYPCVFMETFCLTAVEGAISKVLCITNKLAALQNTVGDRGISILGDASTTEWKQEAIDTVSNVIKDIQNGNVKKYQDLIQTNYEWAKKMTWENQAIDFINKYLPDNFIMSGNLLGWTHNIPHNSLKHISELLENNFKNKKANILEIGTYAGNSIIKMLELLPDSNATVIDRWEDYVEQNKTKYMKRIENIFHRNIKIAKCENRVNILKGDSYIKILELVKSKESYFDIIFVDGSHKPFDVYIDVKLSWEILKYGGIMIIDDYLFYNSLDESENEFYNTPKYAIDKFVNSLHPTSFTIISCDTRLILKKL